MFCQLTSIYQFTNCQYISGVGSTCLHCCDDCHAHSWSATEIQTTQRDGPVTERKYHESWMNRFNWTGSTCNWKACPARMVLAHWIMPQTSSSDICYTYWGYLSSACWGLHHCCTFLSKSRMHKVPTARLHMVALGYFQQRSSLEILETPNAPQGQSISHS